MAAATGCGSPASSAAAVPRRTAASCSGRASGNVATTDARPSVSVPVLSRATRRKSLARSRAGPPRMSAPRRAPAPTAFTTASGVARPSAHGHATTSTVTARATASLTPAVTPTISSVAAATASTTGTNTPATASASLCEWDFAKTASSATAARRPVRVSEATRVDPHDEHGGEVHGARPDLVARRSRGWQRLAGEARAVQLALAAGHDAVDGHSLARPHGDQSAGLDLGDRHAGRLGQRARLRQQPRFLGRCGRGQHHDRPRGVTLPQRLEPAAEQHDRRDHGGGLEVGGAAAGERGPDAVEPRGPRPQDHERVHRRAPHAGRAPRAREERPAGVEQHHERPDGRESSTRCTPAYSADRNAG